MLVDSRWVGKNGIGKFSSELFSRLKGNVSGFILPISPTHPMDFLYLSWFLFRNRDKLVFSPGFNAPLIGLKHYIFTVHDLNHIDIPYNSNFFKKIYYKLIIKRACKHAYRVLTVSEFSRQRIVEWSGANPRNVINVGNGVDKCFNLDVLPYKPGFRYLLCVSNRKEHKNEVGLIKAFASANIESSIKLFFTGTVTEKLKILIENIGLQERIVFGGLISDRNLPHLYKGAEGLVFPSLYEGFGLPVIEAMACGIPVLTSNVTSLPEVAGQAALLVDPKDEVAISEGIESLVYNDQLRTILIRKGIERARMFSWDRVADRVVSIINSAELEEKI
ncbi:glycosyltransferase family 4 protein [Celerinatantimonas sp. MCCC 1A17872]|uniref:glycosyltransferase family 4 protein n=1 Tax=Celerinatantimonas sp. MCCC 1A17872 TaxID=3177514 RepID=UPI0038BE47B8